MTRFNRGHFTCGLGGILLLSPFVIGWWNPTFNGHIQHQPESRPALAGPEAPPPDFGPYTVDLRRLTPEEINRIRYMELRGMRMRTDLPDRVTVKIPKQTVDDFLKEMEGHADFRGEESRRAFRRLMPPQKLHYIAEYMKESYADRVDIVSDPEMFVEFKKQVMPQVLRGCANTGCHAPGSGDEVKFRLFKDPKRTPETLYANFIILNDLYAGGQPVINRAQVGDSLLLTYMLPSQEVRPELRHPGKLEIKPLFRNRGALQYKRIERWIGDLKNPPSNYGVRLVRPLSADVDEDLVPPSTQPQP